MLDGLHGETYNFADVVSKAQERCVETFSTSAKEALVEGTDWAWEDELESLEDEVKAVADQCRKDETKKMLNQIEVIIDSTFYGRKLIIDALISCRGTSRNKFPNPSNFRSTKPMLTCGTISYGHLDKLWRRPSQLILPKLKVTHSKIYKIICSYLFNRLQLHG